MKKLIIYKWNAYNEKYLIDKLKQLGNQIIEYDHPFMHPIRDMKVANELINLVNTEHVDGIISLNYIPLCSMVCDICKIKYYSWVFNSPHLTLFAKPVSLNCNRIGVFDRQLSKMINDSGCNTVFHLPLATDVDKYDQVINENKSQTDDTSKYTCDVSFVGSLYTDKSKRNNYDDLKAQDLSEAVDSKVESIWRRIDNLVNVQALCYDHDYLSDIEECDYYYLLDVIRKNGFSLGDDYYDFDDQVIFNSILAKKVTIIERNYILNRIALACKGKYDFRLYTGSDVSNSQLLEACKKGTVKYDTEMPIVFSDSRINVNISLKAIKTGIPLRVLDIMGCGGFLLTDPQSEILEYFNENKEIVVYRSVEDCIDKIDYYLNHEDKRKQIALAGKKAVKERFSYEKMLNSLLNEYEK